MAAEYINSDLITAYRNKERIRTMNYRGSLLNTTVTDTSTWAKKDVNSILYLTLIPFSASIKSIQVSFNAAITADTLSYSVGFAGINPDQSFTVIKDDWITVPAKERAANLIEEIVPADLWDKTIYQQLCAGEHSLPITEFEKYSNTKYGVLFFKVLAAETTTNPTDIRVNISFVEGSPSEAPLINKSYSGKK